jgi:hypothetical protein
VAALRRRNDLLNHRDKVLAQVTTAQHPDVVKVYEEAELVTRARTALSAADRRELNELLAGLHASGDRRPSHQAGGGGEGIVVVRAQLWGPVTSPAASFS